MSAAAPRRVVTDELELLAEGLPLQGIAVVELGCGNARLLRRLLATNERSHGMGLEVDLVEHAKNLAQPAPRLSFAAASAQAIPAADAQFDLALMLKSLHHVPLPHMDAALAEAWRVLKPGAWLYVSEPVYDGALNQVMRLFNDEGAVRAAAQAALQRASLHPGWQRERDIWFDVPVHYRDFADFEHRMLDVTYVQRQFDAALRARIRRQFEPHLGAQGAHFTRPMHATWLRKKQIAPDVGAAQG